MRRALSISTEGSDSASSLGSASPVKKKHVSKIKLGLRNSNPAAIVLWAFHKNPTKKGMTSRKVIQYLKRNKYTFGKRPQTAGKTIGSILRCATEFGLLSKRGNRYYIASH